MKKESLKTILERPWGVLKKDRFEKQVAMKKRNKKRLEIKIVLKKELNSSGMEFFSNDIVVIPK